MVAADANGEEAGDRRFDDGRAEETADRQRGHVVVVLLLLLLVVVIVVVLVVLLVVLLLLLAVPLLLDLLLVLLLLVVLHLVVLGIDPSGRGVRRGVRGSILVCNRGESRRAHRLD